MKFEYANDTLLAYVSGSFEDDIPLANITILGKAYPDKKFDVAAAGVPCDTSGASMYANGTTTYVTGLSSLTGAGAWKSDLKMSFL